jgi:hypothetical protein
MSRDNEKKNSKAVQNSQVESAESSVKLPIELVKKIRTFAALTNNHLMTRNTVGDEILEAAKIMNEAHDIVKEIDDNGY